MSVADTLAPRPVDPVPDRPDPGPPPAKSPRRLAAELVGSLAVIFALAVTTGHLDLLVVILAIIVIVMVHELGHFLAAKRGGMKVTEYFVGFGPRLWSFKRGETEYGIKALPLGGYVKIPGMTNLEEVDPADEGRLYRDKPFGARLLVAVAGSAMHFLMAFVLLWVLFTFIGVPNADQVQIQGISTVGGRPGPAAVAGLRSGDIVVAVDGKRVAGNVNTLIAAIKDHPDRPVTVVVDRNGLSKTLTVTPANGRVDHEAGAVAPKGDGHAPYGVIGVSLGEPTQLTNPVHALVSTGAGFGTLFWSSIAGIGHLVSLFSPHGISQRFQQVGSAKAAQQAAVNGTRPLSTVGVVQTANDAAQAGIGQFLYFLALINIFLGVFNLFPMLPLDGGHVAIAVYEKIRTGRRKVMYHADVAKLMPYTWTFLLLIGILVLPALLTDILHPVANPFG